jgi:tRNA A37 threonylcarbamoyladenosine synthetase subunit TsaC/SUA5/YrdC
MDVKELYLDAPGTPGILADYISNGRKGIAAIAYGEVYALVADANDEVRVRDMREIKTRDKKPFGLLHSLDIVRHLVSFHEVLPHHYRLLNNAKELVEIFGNTAFIRFPFKRAAAKCIPAGMCEGNIVQLFSFEGATNGAFEVERAVQEKLSRSSYSLFGLLAITSLNYRGQDAIRTTKKAVEFCEEVGIEYVVHNTNQDPTGSYSIFRFLKDGVECARKGTGEEKIKERLTMI